MASVQLDIDRDERSARRTASDRISGEGVPWQELRRYLHAIVLRRSDKLSLEDRSDVVQQTLLEAQQLHITGSPPSETQHYRNWLRKILCCNLADAAREALRQKRDVRREVRFASGEDGGRESCSPAIGQVVADQTSPSQLFARTEREQAVRQAIDGLPAQYRRVICLKFFDNLQVAEIATEVALTKSSVAGLLCRGMRKLQCELSKQGITVE